MAAAKGYEEIVSLLINKPSINSDRKTTRGKTPLLFAAKHGHVEVVRRLLANGGVEKNTRALGLTPLLGEMYRRHEQVVEVLLQNENINPTLQGLGSRWTSTPLMESLDQTNILKLLLEKNIDVKFRPRRTGSTVLTQAVRYKEVDVVKMLLDHGADVNISDLH
jgi:ankyrin repeat protein